MSRHPEDKRRYTEATRKLKDRIKWIKEEAFQTHLQILTATADTDSSLWKATKPLKQPTQRIPPIRNDDQTWARSDQDKANTFAGHLEKTFKPNELPQNENLGTEINKALKEPLQIRQPIKFLITYSLTYRADPFLRSCQLRSHSGTSQHFKENEGSSPCSQDPSTGPYPESDRSSPYHPILSP
jgi:hypothetical protein